MLKAQWLVAISARRWIAMVSVWAVVAGVLGVPATARAEDGEPVVTVAERRAVVSAWQLGGPLVRAAAESALLGSAADMREFLSNVWQQRQRVDERVMVNRMMAGSGPAVQAAAQTALDATGPDALSAFLESGWQLPAGIDQRVRVNQMMAAGGTQLRAAAQRALDADAVEDPDSEVPSALEVFIESGWKLPYGMDQRIRVNQILAAAAAGGGDTVVAAAQRALDADNVDALTEFIESGWAVAATRDQEITTLRDLAGAAQAASELATQQTQIAKDESAKAVAAAAAARVAALQAADAASSAQGNAKAAAAAAQQAANAAENAARAARQAVSASQAAIAAARVAAAAASRAASAAALTQKAATRAHKAAANAATDATKANDARNAAAAARDAGRRAQDAATAAGEAGRVAQESTNAARAAGSAGAQALLAVTAAEDALRHAKATGVNVEQAEAAARRARANAARANRAAAASAAFADAAAIAAFASRDAASRAVADANAAADLADEAAAHAGDATRAAERSTNAANAATRAANDALAAAEEAKRVYDAARAAEAERLAIALDEGLEAASAASAEWTDYQQKANFDAQEAAKRSAETNRLIAEVNDPASPRDLAVADARKVAFALTNSNGSWTRSAAIEALGGTDEEVLLFVRTGIGFASAQDDRVTVAGLAATGSDAMAAAAEDALAGSNADVAEFLRTQTYPGRATEDRITVNQILATARDSDGVHLMQRAQQALDAGTDQALQDFVRNGQYEAAAADDRVRVNRILGDPTSGPELRAAAQVALDGPPSALRQFLEYGRYSAARNDQDSATHDAEASALLAQAAAAANTALQQAQEAQAVAATARGAAAEAQQWVAEARTSADRAAGFASQAVDSADRAETSAEDAAASARAAVQAAARANQAAQDAGRSALWAQHSYGRAVGYANGALEAAVAAWDSAIAAGEDAAAAEQYYRDAYQHAVDQAEADRQAANASQTLKCQAANIKGSREYKDCLHHVTDSDSLKLGKATLNAEMCKRMGAPGSIYYQNCVQQAFNPSFMTYRTLDIVGAFLMEYQAFMVSLGAVEAVVVTALLCNAVCGALLGLSGGAEALMGIGGLFDLWLGSALVDLAAGTIIGGRTFVGLRGLMGLRIPAVFQKLVVENEAREAMLGRVGKGFLSCLRQPNSFAKGTPVLLADGTGKAIQDVRPGDQVMATDPYTNITRPEPVNATIAGSGEKKLVDLTVDIDGYDGEVTATITATDNHPFWIEKLGKWIDAGDLRAGDLLRTDGTAFVPVVSIQQYVERTLVYNLTVADLHTYYVLADDQAVLVHNVYMVICLPAHEAAGGHTIRQHVGKTDAELIARTQGENAPIRASTFVDKEAATSLTESNIRRNSDKVAQFLGGNKYKVVLYLEISTDGPVIGRVYDATSGTFLRPNSIETWLVKDPNMPGGYYVETSYPIVR